MERVLVLIANARRQHTQTHRQTHTVPLFPAHPRLLTLKDSGHKLTAQQGR